MGGDGHSTKRSEKANESAKRSAGRELITAQNEAEIIVPAAVHSSEDQNEKQSHESSGNVIKYVVPVFGLGTNSQTWRVAKMYRESIPILRPGADEKSRRRHGINSGSGKILDDTQLSVSLSAYECDKRRKQIVESLKEKARARERMITNSREQQKRSDENRGKIIASGICRALIEKSMTLQHGREFVRIGREVTVAEVNGGKLLVGMYPLRIPVKRNIQNSDDNLSMAQSPTIEPIETEKENVRDITLRRRGKGVKRKPLQTRNISKGLLMLLNRLHTKILDESVDEIVLYGKCFMGRLGIYYSSPVSLTSVRCVCMIIELRRNTSIEHHPVGVVRFVADANGSSGGTLQESDIHLFCFCSSFGTNEQCAHLEKVRSDPEIMHAAYKVLSVDATRQEPVSTVHPWRCLTIGSRESPVSAIWKVIQTGEMSVLSNNFVPVIEKRSAQSSPILLRRLRCGSCRRNSGNRGSCEHETSVAMAIQKLLPAVESNLSTRDSLNDVNHPESCSDEEYDSLQDEKDLGKARVNYVSTLPRRVVPCRSDKNAVNDLLLGVAASIRSDSTDEEKGKGQQNRGRKIRFVAYDNVRECESCNFIMRCDETGRNCSVQQRVVLLHTLLHGTMDIMVLDLLCGNCSQVSYFDGRDAAMFSASPTMVYSREILDYWLYQVAMVGGTFREAYELSKQVSKCTSASYSRLGRPLSCRRRHASSAFADFLRTMAFPKEDLLSKVFSCSTCEKVDQQGTKRFKAIVLDGTATGILGDLPNYDRPALIAEAAKATTKLQFIFAAAKARAFFASFFSKSASSSQQEEFDFNCTDLKTSECVSKIIFPQDPSVSSAESAALVTLISTLYNLEDLKRILSNSQRRRHGKDIASIIVRHKPMSSSLRRSMANFARSVSTTSVPISLLCSDKKIQSAAELSAEVDRFRYCQHVKHPSTAICVKCTVSFAKSGSRFKNELPVACALVSELAESMVDSPTTSPARNFGEALSCLLRACVSLCFAFNSRFGDKEADAAKRYTALYKSPTTEQSLVGPATFKRHHDNEGFLAVSQSESAICGELYPGRPLVRARVRFSNGNTGDGWSLECSKSYRNGANHSPGLFTVQCACSHPKLIGISVMQQNESVATALSAILSRFPVLPEAAFYDKACNLDRSTALRFPWVKERTAMLCDRFHFKTHKCGAEYDPDSYPWCDGFLTSGAEALNRQWSSSRNHIRFLSGENLIPFIYVRSLFINLRAHIRDVHKTADVEDEDVSNIADQLMPCECLRCKTVGNKDENVREQQHSTVFSSANVKVLWF